MDRRSVRKWNGNVKKFWLRLRADLTAALGHIDAIGQLSPRPRQLKGKGKGTPIVLPDPADDPITSTTQAELIHGEECGCTSW